MEGQHPSGFAFSGQWWQLFQTASPITNGYLFNDTDYIVQISPVPEITISVGNYCSNYEINVESVPNMLIYMESPPKILIEV